MKEDLQAIYALNNELLRSARHKGTFLEDKMLQQMKLRKSEERNSIVVYGGFQDPKFRRQSMKTRARERKEKGREERKS